MCVPESGRHSSITPPTSDTPTWNASSCQQHFCRESRPPPIMRAWSATAADWGQGTADQSWSTRVQARIPSCSENIHSVMLGAEVWGCYWLSVRWGAGRGEGRCEIARAVLLIPRPGDHQLMCPAPFMVSLPIVPAVSPGSSQQTRPHRDSLISRGCRVWLQFSNKTPLGPTHGDDTMTGSRHQ